ncbi:MAG TPA: hypothetical protein VFJ77_12445 [Gaiellaceae bacterium]|nr:hypothetical protein [Gaiellaceae bacterium]
MRAILLGLALAACTAAVAVAAPPPGKGKHGGAPATSHGKKPKTGAGCRPQVSVILKGTLAADGAAAPSSLSVTVTGGNRAGRAYRAATQPVAVSIDTSTRVGRRGKHDPTLLQAGDRVVVQARVCKADLAQGAAPSLTATRVTANPAKPPHDASSRGDD